MTFAAARAAGDDQTPPPWLDRRFDAQGRPVRDSGATVICHIGNDAQNDALAAARDRIRAVEDGRVFAWLPPSSYHMTVFDFLLHSRRAPEHWPQGLAPDAAGAEADLWAADQLRDFALEETPPFRVAPQGVYLRTGGLGVALAGADAREEARLRRLRDRMAAATGLAHRPGHAAYPFHITLAYLIAWPDEEQGDALDLAIDAAARALVEAVPAFTLSAPEFCVFHDMTAFARAFRLR